MGDLLTDLAAAGLSVVPGPGPGQLLLRGPAAAKTPAVVYRVKAYKAELLGHLGGGQPSPPPDRPAGATDELPVTCPKCRGRWGAGVTGLDLRLMCPWATWQPACPLLARVPAAPP